MASRRTRKRSGKGKKGKTRAELKKLLHRAEAEVEKLIKDAEVGVLTRAKLTARLEEVEKTLDEMEPLEDG